MFLLNGEVRLLAGSIPNSRSSFRELH